MKYINLVQRINLGGVKYVLNEPKWLLCGQEWSGPSLVFLNRFFASHEAEEVQGHNSYHKIIKQSSDKR